MTKKVKGAIVTKVNKKTNTITLRSAQVDPDIVTLQEFSSQYNIWKFNITNIALIDIVKILVQRELERSQND